MLTSEALTCILKLHEEVLRINSGTTLDAHTNPIFKQLTILKINSMTFFSFKQENSVLVQERTSSNYFQ